MESANQTTVVLRRNVESFKTSGAADDILPQYLLDLEKAGRRKPRRRSWHSATNFDVQWHGICSIRYLGGQCFCCADKPSPSTGTKADDIKKLTEAPRLESGRRKYSEKNRQKNRLVSIKELTDSKEALFSELHESTTKSQPTFPSGQEETSAKTGKGNLGSQSGASRGQIVDRNSVGKMGQTDTVLQTSTGVGVCNPRLQGNYIHPSTDVQKEGVWIPHQLESQSMKKIVGGRGLPKEDEACPS